MFLQVVTDGDPIVGVPGPAGNTAIFLQGRTVPVSAQFLAPGSIGSRRARASGDWQDPPVRGIYRVVMLIAAALIIAGAIFLIWADTVARTVLGVVELPVGVVTSLCGGPFFVYLLKREGRKTFGS